MSDYAIVLYFDSESEKRLNDVLENVASATNNNYMLEKNITPHITVASFIAENSNEIERRVNLAVESNKFSAFDVFFSSIGVFNPQVIFLSPVMSKTLLDCCKTANELICDFQVGDNGNYLPYKWVPHLALAYKLTNENINSAFSEVVIRFTPFCARVTRVALVKCNPYREITRWDLKQAYI